MEKLDFIVREGWESFLKEHYSWAAFVPEVAEDTRGNKYIRNTLSPNSKIYKVVRENDQGDQGYECNDFGSEIIGATVAHPIHDGPFPLSGSGKCHYEEVPYCPKCEEKPSHSGAFITAPKR